MSNSIVDFQSLPSTKQAEYLCGICQELCRDPSNLACCNTSNVCISCFKKYLDKQRAGPKNSRPPIHCMFCRVQYNPDYEPQPSASLRARLTPLRLLCRNAEIGCTATYIYGHDGAGEKAHLAECEYKDVKMPCCDAVIPLCEKMNHFNANEWGCPNSVQCPQQCKQIIVSTELNKHIRTFCPSTNVKCEFCGSTMKRRDYHSTHKRYACMKVPETCDVCKITLPREEMNKHRIDKFICVVLTQCPLGCIITDYPDDWNESQKSRKSSALKRHYPDGHTFHVIQDQLCNHILTQCAKRTKITAPLVE